LLVQQGANEQTKFGRVRYFFTLDFEGEERALAMVQLMDRVDQNLYIRSSKTAYVGQFTGRPGTVLVVEHTAIVASVMCQPCPTSGGRRDWAGWWFVGEKLGQNLNWAESEAGQDDEEYRAENDD